MSLDGEVCGPALTLLKGPGAPLSCVDDEAIYKTKDVKKSHRKETLNKSAGEPLSMRPSRNHQQYPEHGQYSHAPLHSCYC